MDSPPSFLFPSLSLPLPALSSHPLPSSPLSPRLPLPFPPPSPPFSVLPPPSFSTLPGWGKVGEVGKERGRGMERGERGRGRKKAKRQRQGEEGGRGEWGKGGRRRKRGRGEKEEKIVTKWGYKKKMFTMFSLWEWAALRHSSQGKPFFFQQFTPYCFSDCRQFYILFKTRLCTGFQKKRPRQTLNKQYGAAVKKRKHGHYHFATLPEAKRQQK